MTVSAVEAGLLCGCRLGIPENPYHVIAAPALILEVPLARFARRQQEHHPVPQEAEACPLLLREVINVFLELPLLSIVLRYKCYDALRWVLLHVLEVGSVTHIQIVVLIRQVSHYVVIF